LWGELSPERVRKTKVKGVGGMDETNLYYYVGVTIVWLFKSLFVPVIVAVITAIAVKKLPQEANRNKIRSKK